MTRKHFEAIADVLRHQHDNVNDPENRIPSEERLICHATIDNVALALADTFAGVNNNFDRVRFIVWASV